MPFAATKVIPAAWSQHHQGAAAGGMNATVTIGSRGQSTYDPATDETTVTWSQEYAGAARVQEFMRATEPVAGEQRVVLRRYLVQIDARISGEGSIKPGMRVRALTAANDAQLVGQDLWVVDVQFGSERFTRDLVCSDNQTDAPAVA